MQENRTFDTYFGMLNKYRANSQTILGTATPWNIGDDGTEYDVDGIVGTASGAPVGNFPTSPGGVANPNAQGGEVPSLLHASDDYTKEEVINDAEANRMLRDGDRGYRKGFEIPKIA